MTDQINPTITRKQLSALPKSKLMDVIRNMEAYLTAMASANDQASWRGAPEAQQRYFTRADAFNEAAARLQQEVL